LHRQIERCLRSPHHRVTLLLQHFDDADCPGDEMAANAQKETPDDPDDTALTNKPK